jgi:hypothetical protein
MQIISPQGILIPFSVQIEQKSRQPYKTIDDRVQNPGSRNLAPYDCIDNQLAKKEDSRDKAGQGYASFALRKE